MLAQAVTKPLTQRRVWADKQAHLNRCKGCAFSDEPHDCIKSLKLGDTLLPKRMSGELDISDLDL